MKYKIGDKVRVREDLVANQRYGDDVFDPVMDSFKGQIVSIKTVYKNKYTIEEDCGDWYWTDEMFLPIIKYKIGDKVIVREDLKVGERYGKNLFVLAMDLFKGKIVTIQDIIIDGYRIIEDHTQWCWSDDMFYGKVSQDFIPEKPVSQNRLPEEESPSDIITIKTTKLKLYF